MKPVAWHEPGSFGNVTIHEKWALENGWLPLYAAPAQPVKQEPVAKYCGYCKSMPCTCPPLPMPAANAAPVQPVKFSNSDNLPKADINVEPVKQELNWGTNKFMPHEQPVKQEPVAVVHNTDTTGNWAIIQPALPAGTKLYGAPVDSIDSIEKPIDAKAILEMRDKAFQSYVDQAKADRELSVLQARMEALEEAAKMAEAYVVRSVGLEIAAAIRGLK